MIKRKLHHDRASLSSKDTVRRKKTAKKRDNKNRNAPEPETSNPRHPRLKLFLDYEQIRFFLNSLLQAYPDNLELEIIGNSKAGRPIFLMLVARQVSLPRKYAVFIEGGSNGEDVVSVASALYIINYLCVHASSSTTLLVMDVYVLPLANPDDYELTLYGKKNSMNLAKSFPFRLAHYNINDIGIENYLEVSHKWKENLVIQNFEKLALIKGIADYQKDIKLFVSLQEEGEMIVYPFGSKLETYDTSTLSYVAKIGKLGSEIDFDIGTIYQHCGVTCGTIVDFLRLFSSFLKFTYIIHVNDKQHGQVFRKVPFIAENVLCVITLMAREIDNYYKTQSFYPEHAQNDSLIRRY
ncbi:unnamed protein product [Phyllotreta striolata]|uniref:Peptidase M14 domain-containing protein n=1 Tax=Phyllotreta striolata TaxID=444603 RepID=A0A9N9TPD5_PHYSR|nr:unnamed protein product [Phyllotreta striolata]